LEFVTILRELWRRRLLVVLVGVLSLAIGFVLVYGPSLPPKRRSYEVGVATARILVDTPQSQVVEVAPEGSDMLGSRASVLANLMVYGELHALIEKRAGLKPNQLIAGSDATGGAAATAPLDRNSRALTTGVVVNSDLAQLPLIKVETQAPTPKEAAKLADAAVEGLIAYVESKSSSQNVTADRRLRVTGLGPAQASEAARGTGRMIGLLAAVFVFGLGCTIIVAVSTVIRAWRAAVALEREFVPDAGDAGDLPAEPMNGSANHRIKAKAGSRLSA
jgi:capsular polysaccharide biosynthesis protein